MIINDLDDLMSMKDTVFSKLENIILTDNELSRIINDPEQLQKHSDQSLVYQIEIKANINCLE